MKRSASGDASDPSRKSSISASLQNGDTAGSDGRAIKRIRISKHADDHQTSDQDSLSKQASNSFPGTLSPDLAPIKKRRGRRPKNGAPTTIIQGDSIPPVAPKVKRPPGRPKGNKPSLLRQDSDKPTAARLPGRQRVPNADAQIESYLVRQSELKRLYKATVAALKPALEVLADHSLQQIQNDETFLDSHPHYDQIRIGLETRLARRKLDLDREAFLERERMERDYQAQKAIITNGFHRKVKDLQDDAILRTKDDYMSVIRGARYEDDDEATEDEEDSQLSERKKYIARSRSAFFIDTKKAWSLLKTQNDIRQKLMEYAPDIAQAKIEGFATYDPDVRLQGIADRNIATLLSAGEKIEKASKQIIRNEEATKLQILAQSVDHIGPNDYLQPGGEMIPLTPSASAHLPRLAPARDQIEFIAQRAPAQPPKQRPEDFAADGTLQVRPVGRVAPSAVRHDRRHSQSGPPAATPLDPSRWHSHSQPPQQSVEFYQDYRLGPEAAVVAQNRPIHHPPVLAPVPPSTIPPAQPTLASPIPYSHQLAPHSVPRRFSPEIDQRGRDTARKAHGPVPAYMQNSPGQGQFSRFPVDSPKKGSNPRPIAAKPSNKTKKPDKVESASKDFPGAGILLSPTSGPNVYHLSETNSGDGARDDRPDPRQEPQPGSPQDSRPRWESLVGPQVKPGPFERPSGPYAEPPVSYPMPQTSQTISPRVYQGPYGPAPVYPNSTPTSRRSSLQGPDRNPAMHPPHARTGPPPNSQPGLPSINTAIPYYTPAYPPEANQPPYSPHTRGPEGYNGPHSAGPLPPHPHPFHCPPSAASQHSPSAYSRARFPPPLVPHSAGPYGGQYHVRPSARTPVFPPAPVYTQFQPGPPVVPGPFYPHEAQQYSPGYSRPPSQNDIHSQPTPGYRPPGSGGPPDHVRTPPPHPQFRNYVPPNQSPQAPAHAQFGRRPS
ncbi:MAG: hypothetical protein M1814_006131 [Vezdaea aestivalis]|nr:MAG: hypothetical protein M1814_006131 [Vezdaea aestivalis]